MSNDQNDKKEEEAHYAAEEYAVDDYAAPATYTVPQGYYNDDGEFVEVSGGATDANQSIPQSYADQNSQYYADPSQYYYGYNYDTTYGDASTAPPGTESASAATGAAPSGTYSYDPYYSQGYYDSSYYTDSANMANSTTASNSTSAYGNSSSMIPPSDSAASSSRMSSAAPTPKPYYPPPANSNQPIGPIVMTRSGYTGQDTSTATASPTITSSATIGEGSSEKDGQNSKKKKKKAAVRAAGGEVWEDTTLLDWDENDYRLFAGDLGNEVTEELLFKTFSKYPSLTRTRVVRDKRTLKSKGYGFISFKDPDDFVRAWREMNGKYVGNRPIKLRKSNWKERNLDVKVKKERERFGPYAKHK